MFGRLELPAVHRVLAEKLFDAQQLVVLRHAVGAAERAGLDLAGVRRDGNVGNGRVFSLARAMADDGGILVIFEPQSAIRVQIQ